MSEPLTFDVVLKAVKKVSCFGLGARVRMSGKSYVDILIHDLGMSKEDALIEYNKMKSKDGTV